MTTNPLLRSQLDAAMTEHQWMEQVVAYARLRGWLCAHVGPAQTSKGWRTAVSYDGAERPDLCLVRERLILAELKTEAGRVSVEQRHWRIALKLAGAEHYLWRPSDWPEVETVLR